jgi:hypothetical protein
MVFFLQKMKSKLLYIVEKEFVSKTVYLEEETEIYSLKTEVNEIAKKHFISIESYYKLVRKKLDLKNKIPIRFSDSLLLFKINSKNEQYAINFYNVLKVCFDDKVKLIFINGLILEIDISLKVIKQELTKINKILEYLDSINL